jgi:hypothetical protein
MDSHVVENGRGVTAVGTVVERTITVTADPKAGLFWFLRPPHAFHFRGHIPVY